MKASEDYFKPKKNEFIKMKHLVRRERKFRTIILSSHGFPSLPSK